MSIATPDLHRIATEQVAENKRLRNDYNVLIAAARSASHATTEHYPHGSFYTDEAVNLQRALSALQVKP